MVAQCFEEMRDVVDVELARYANKIAPLIKDEKSRQRWMIRYRDYFPKGPPPPPMPRITPGGPGLIGPPGPR